MIKWLRRQWLKVQVGSMATSISGSHSPEQRRWLEQGLMALVIDLFYICLGSNCWSLLIKGETNNSSLCQSLHHILNWIMYLSKWSETSLTAPYWVKTPSPPKIIHLDLPYEIDKKKQGLCVSEPLHFATQCLKDVFEKLC